MKIKPSDFNVEKYIDQVQELGKLYEIKFHTCFSETIDEFNKEHAKVMYLYNARDYANNFHAHLRGRVRYHFRNLPGVFIEEKPGRAFMVIINGNEHGIPVWLVIRFKKINQNLRAASIPTNAVKDFFGQGQLEFIGFMPVIQDSLFPDPEFANSSASTRIVNLPKAHNLVAGYCPDNTWTMFEILGLTLPLNLKKSKMMCDFTSISNAVAVSEIAEFPAISDEITKKPKRVKQRQNEKKPIKQKLRKHIKIKEESIQETDKKKRKLNE